MSTAGASATASNATVDTSSPVSDVQAYREQLADDAEAGVKAVRAQIKSLQDSLKVREAEAKRLRADVKEG